MNAATSQKAGELFSKFCGLLATVDLRHAVLVPAGIGAVIALTGVGQEVHGQAELLRSSGAMALDAYKSAMQLHPVETVTEYMRLAFSGSLPSFGGNTQGIGVGVLAGGSALATSAVLLAKGFVKMKDSLIHKVESIMSSNKETIEAVQVQAYTPTPSAPLNHRLGGIQGVYDGMLEREGQLRPPPRTHDRGDDSDDEDDAGSVPRM